MSFTGRYFNRRLWVEGILYVEQNAENWTHPEFQQSTGVKFLDIQISDISLKTGVPKCTKPEGYNIR